MIKGTNIAFNVYYIELGYQGGQQAIMTIREAIKILMLSPIYYRMNLKDRKKLINEFCSLHGNSGFPG